MKKLLTNLVMVIVSLTVGLLFVELIMRIEGRYADLVDENLVLSRALWDRPANAIQYRKHPDLEFEVEIVFNDFQIRNHDGINLGDIRQHEGKLVGVFGDSMTENRRVQNEFSFTTILDRTLRPEYRVLNFGVDGYGPDQSYLKYLDFPERKRLTHVFYIFSSNDLRNIYENQLFDFGNDWLGEPKSPEINPAVALLRRLHLTYLILDSYLRIKASLADQVYRTDKINKKIVYKFAPNEARLGRRQRYHDEYADSMATDLLSDTPSESTLAWGKRFNLLVSAWKRDVEANGSEFTIFFTPSWVATDLTKKLFEPNLIKRSVYLIDFFPEGYENFIFQSDVHWNEEGNLRAAQGIIAWGEDSGLWYGTNERITEISQRVKAAIDRLYED